MLFKFDFFADDRRYLAEQVLARPLRLPWVAAGFKYVRSISELATSRQQFFGAALSRAAAPIACRDTGNPERVGLIRLESHRLDCRHQN